MTAWYDYTIMDLNFSEPFLTIYIHRFGRLWPQLSFSLANGFRVPYLLCYEIFIFSDLKFPTILLLCWNLLMLYLPFQSRIYPLSQNKLWHFCHCINMDSIFFLLNINWIFILLIVCDSLCSCIILCMK